MLRSSIGPSVVYRQSGHLRDVLRLLYTSSRKKTDSRNPSCTCCSAARAQVRATACYSLSNSPRKSHIRGNHAPSLKVDPSLTSSPPTNRGKIP
ncbi:hypothetical protein F2Q68_00021863 [Brassica cretica]|uniref:Uncharacterized protein n=1 Tax=Brassica cretica TaxID=69181 RepID=A0A8S9FMZ3_BRACR|nr:hypothetical protein F2Q68_00021863 [Brassica cretica]